MTETNRTADKGNKVKSGQQGKEKEANPEKALASFLVHM